MVGTCGGSAIWKSIATTAPTPPARPRQRSTHRAGLGAVVTHRHSASDERPVRCRVLGLGAARSSHRGGFAPARGLNRRARREHEARLCTEASRPLKQWNRAFREATHAWRCVRNRNASGSGNQEGDALLFRRGGDAQLTALQPLLHLTPAYVLVVPCRLPRQRPMRRMSTRSILQSPRIHRRSQDSAIRCQQSSRRRDFETGPAKKESENGNG